MEAVQDIDLNMRSGQVFGFLGPNGAGKSTTIKMLTTLIKPTSGSLRVLEIDAVKNPIDVRRKIGVVLQQPSYEPSLTVEKSLYKYGMMWDVPAVLRKERVEDLLFDFDLSNIRHKKNEDLSIGQRRRVQVAREFMHDMDLLFLDEPTVGLDPSARRRLLDYLKTRVKDGLSIFFTTHVLSEAEYLCDEIAIINSGKIISFSTPEELKRTFGHERTINIRLADRHESVGNLLKNLKNCDVTIKDGKNITVQSGNSEFVLLKILNILNDNNIEIQDLTSEQTSLEDIFLKILDHKREDASYSKTS